MKKKRTKKNGNKEEKEIKRKGKPFKECVYIT